MHDLGSLDRPAVDGFIRRNLLKEHAAHVEHEKEENGGELPERITYPCVQMHRWSPASRLTLLPGAQLHEQARQGEFRRGATRSEAPSLICISYTPGIPMGQQQCARRIRIDEYGLTFSLLPSSLPGPNSLGRAL